MQQNENIDRENQQTPKSTMSQGDDQKMSEKDNLEGVQNGQDGLSKETEALEKLNQELDEYKDKYLRTVAEMDNLRKRLARERNDLLRFGAESLMRDLLPVLDSFDKACEDAKNADKDNQQFVEGISLVRKQLLDTLEKHGMTPVDAVGHAFDPNMHQAIQRVDSEEVDADQVHQEFAKGYMLHDRLLRPAIVSVAVPAKKDQKKE